MLAPAAACAGTGRALLTSAEEQRFELVMELHAGLEPLLEELQALRETWNVHDRLPCSTLRVMFRSGPRTNFSDRAVIGARAAGRRKSDRSQREYS